MDLSTFVYLKVLKSRGFSRASWTRVRRLLVRLFDDPECLMLVHNKNLYMPLSHALPSRLQSHPFYDRLPKRLGDFMRERYGTLVSVDVGANIGDSIAAFDKQDRDIFLAIEPNPKFNAYLRKNWSKDTNVTIIDTICSSRRESKAFDFEEKFGTASVMSGVGKQRTADTLDNIVLEHKKLLNLNLLKIDTDGYDFEVIQGATAIIAKNLPAIFFECGVFSNPTYVESCMAVFAFFKSVGYESLLLYDNFGYLMGKYHLDRPCDFLDMIFYEVTSDFHYFDILVMKQEDIEAFFCSERNSYMDHLSNKVSQHAAMMAANFPHGSMD